MKILLVIFFLCISLCQVQAQKAVNISGQVINFNSEELLYLIVGEQIFPIEPSSDGNFAVDYNIQELPAFFYLEQISKQGKREQRSPLIWFEGDHVEIQIDWTDKSFKMEGEMPFQAA